MRYFFALSILAVSCLVAGAQSTVEFLPRASNLVRVPATDGASFGGPVIVSDVSTNDVIITIQYSGTGTNALRTIASNVRIPAGQRLTRDMLFANGIDIGTESFTATIQASAIYMIGANAVLEFNAIEDVEVEIPTSIPPTITILTPSDSDTDDAEWLLSLTSSFTEGSGNRIASIYYPIWQGTNLVANVSANMSTNTYEGIYTLTTPGTYTTFAKLIYDDVNGASMAATSATNSITVTAPGITPSIDVLASTVTIAVGETFTASASLSSGTITRIDFYENDVLIDSDTSDPYSITWTPSTPGVRTLKATVIRAEGGSGSASQSVTVVPVANQFPTAEITYEAELSDSELPTLNLIFSYAVTDLDGTVDQIEFRRESGVISTLTVDAPYTTGYITNNGATLVTDRGYIWDIIATDDDGDSTSSSYVNVNITTAAAPPYSFTGPGNGSAETGQSITLTSSETNGPADSYAWVKSSGPGVITFGSETAIATTASFDTAGTYVVQVTATKGATSYVRTGTYTITTAPEPEPSDPVNSMTLPLLVFDDGTIDGKGQQSLVFKTPDDYVQIAGTELELLTFNLSHANTASVKVGTDSKRAIRQGTVTILENQLNNAAGGDGYLGDFPIKRIRVPINSGKIVAGDNTLTFYFESPWSAGFDTTGIGYNQGHHSSAGYRVLYWNLIEPDGTRVFDSSDYTVTDYSAFSAPAGGNAATGQTLWEDDTILTSSPDNAVPKRTACFDCHGSGAPLNYYRFENEVITARSMFHGLTETQGNHIAAYIRSLTPAQSSTNAFPWSLPYQPGSNLANLSTHHWAAGEMKAHAIVPTLRIPDVLDTAAEQRTEIYGATVEDADLHYTTSADFEWKKRIIFQLISYHQWVPDIHPKEFMGSRTAWNNSTYKAKLDAFRAHFTSAASNSTAIYKWEEIRRYGYEFIENEMADYFGVSSFNGDNALYAYSAKKISALDALDMEIKWNLSSVDIYPTVDWDNSREYPNSSIYFDASPLQSHVTTGYTGHAFGNRKIASRIYFDISWYFLQMAVNPWMGGDNRFIDSGRNYFYGRIKDWQNQLPDGEDESLFGTTVMLHNVLLRMCQRSANVNNRNGGAYLPHFNPEVLTGTRNTDKGTDSQTLPMLLAAINNFMDYVDAIPVSTWQTASVVTSMTSGATHTGDRVDSNQLQIWYELLYNLRNTWSVSASDATYLRVKSKASAIWPSQSTWP